MKIFIHERVKIDSNFTYCLSQSSMVELSVAARIPAMLPAIPFASSIESNLGIFAVGDSWAANLGLDFIFFLDEFLLFPFEFFICMSTIFSLSGDYSSISYSFAQCSEFSNAVCVYFVSIN